MPGGLKQLFLSAEGAALLQSLAAWCGRFLGLRYTHRYTPGFDAALLRRLRAHILCRSQKRV